MNDNPAVDLRDSRRTLVSELSSIMSITTTELSNGSLLVQSDGRTLVFQGEHRGMYIDRSEGLPVLGIIVTIVMLIHPRESWVV